MEKELDNSILFEFKKGEFRAFQMVFNFYYEEIFVFAFKIVRVKEDAEDIAMEIFIKLFRMYKQFETGPNIRAFLFISTRNKCLNYIRSKENRGEREKNFAKEMESDENLEPEYDVNNDRLNKIKVAVNKLPKTCKRVFKLLYFEEYETAEVARKLGISLDNVRQQKKRALDIIRIQL